MRWLRMAVIAFRACVLVLIPYQRALPTDSLEVDARGIVTCPETRRQITAGAPRT